MFPVRLSLRLALCAVVFLFPSSFLSGVVRPAEAQGALVKPPDSIPLPGTTDVHGNVTVEAGLLPYSVSRRIFGTEIAKHYAIVQLVVSNHDAGDAMIIQSVFLDYTHWLFSGTFAALESTAAGTDGLTPFQASNLPYQVASTEARLVRSELQDAQQWTARNWTVRSAVLVGATAVGYQFLFGEDFAKGSNAFNGALIPGLQQLWPDNVQTQINRISDFGFGTNHVIPKNSSDVIVGFFPLDRFLTPDLQDVFRGAPSAFFNPSEMLLDRRYSTVLLNMLRRAGALEGAPVPEMPKHCWNKAPGRCWVLTDDEQKRNKAGANRVSSAILRYEQFQLAHQVTGDATQRAAEEKERAGALAAACKAPPTQGAPPPPNAKDAETTPAAASQELNSQDCLILTLLNKVSLNNIRVVASGIMTVDTSKVPANLSAVQFASEAAAAGTWAGPADPSTAPSPRTGTLVGTFLAGGVPQVAAVDADGKPLDPQPLTALTVDALHSDDNHLVFTYAVSHTVPAGTQLNFTVVKKSKDGSEVQSAPISFTVTY